MEDGGWMLGVGCWVMDVGCRMMEDGFLKLEVRNQKLEETNYNIQFYNIHYTVKSLMSQSLMSHVSYRRMEDGRWRMDVGRRM